MKAQLGEEFFSAGNQLRITAPMAKNWEYYCSLTDEEVLEEYWEYYGKTHPPYGDRYIKNGIIYNDLVMNTSFDIAYGLLDPCTFTFNASVLSTSMPVTGDTEPDASSFGFPEDVTVTFDHWKGAPSTVHFADDRMDSRSVYDFMRRELTLYNSYYYKHFSEEGGINWYYQDFVPEFTAGDANGDGQMDLNDAVAVLQQVALPNKYPICERCAELADCDSIYGINGLDALAIQQVDAGMIQLSKSRPV